MASSSTRSSANASAAKAACPWGKPLGRAFYERDTLGVAQELLGKLVVVRPKPAFAWDDPRAGVTVSRIVETEAYHGSDPASHSCRGRTERNAVMFGPPGVAYVYFIYGMYEMLNFVTEREGYAGAVLIRAVEPAGGPEVLERMRRRRGSKVAPTLLTNGPGRLSQALGVRLSHKGESLQGPVFHVIDDGLRAGEIRCSPRVGIRVGTDLYWRYFLADNPWVSRCRENAEGRPLPISPRGRGTS